jgi:hypothetical protein
MWYSHSHMTTYLVLTITWLFSQLCDLRLTFHSHVTIGWLPTVTWPPSFSSSSSSPSILILSPPLPHLSPSVLLRLQRPVLWFMWTSALTTHTTLTQAPCLEFLFMSPKFEGVKEVRASMADSLVFLCFHTHHLSWDIPLLLSPCIVWKNHSVLDVLGEIPSLTLDLSVITIIVSNHSSPSHPPTVVYFSPQFTFPPIHTR